MERSQAGLNASSFSCEAVPGLSSTWVGDHLALGDAVDSCQGIIVEQLANPRPQRVNDWPD